MTKLKGAIVGFGNIAANGHWPGYAESSSIEIVNVVDPSPERRKTAEALKPGIKTYASFEEFMQAQHPGLDFVDICTPPVTHVKMSQECIRRGWHVLCEKPLSLSVGDYTLLARHVERQKKTVFTVHNWKYAPIFQKTMQTLRGGRIGSVWHAEIFVQRDSHCKGTAQGASNGPGAIAVTKSEDWRKDRDFAGCGILVDHGWHSFYLLLNVVGATPESIIGKMHSDAKDKNALEDAAQVLIQFPEADGYIHLTWKAKMRRNSIIVQGDKGTLLLDDDRLMLTTHDGQKEETLFETALSAGSHHADWFRNLLPDFIEEIRNPAKRGANLREAGWCVALTCAAYESNIRGFQEVQVQFPGTPKKSPALV
jgi:predicted dehydrogenase